MEMILGNSQKAVIPAERAVKLDPLSTYTHVFLSEIYLANKNFEKALNESIDARRLQPEYGIAHYIEGICLHHLEKYTEAQISFNHALELTDPESALSHADIQSALAVSLAAGNKPDSAQEILNQLLHQKKQYASGLIHATFGDYDKALPLFIQEKNWGAFSTPLIRYLYPDLLKPIRSSDEFHQIIKKVNRSLCLQ